MEWARLVAVRYPELQLLHHIPNGGKRRAAEAARFKAAGVKPGVPDLCLPAPRGGYHGLYIELKARGGRLSESQIEWLDALSRQRYYAVCCVGAEEAINTIDAYLQGEIEVSGSERQESENFARAKKSTR